MNSKQFGCLLAGLTGLITVETAAAQAVPLQRIEGDEAKQLAQQLGLSTRIERLDGSVIELMRFVDGRPEYYATCNAASADTISTDDARLYLTNLTLDGSTVRLGIWDGGGTRVSHQEFGTRATQRDTASGTNGHATHVAGTLAASGVQSSARGMAPNALLDCYEWTNDTTEMSAAVSAGVSLSNHSYATVAGWATGLRGDPENWYWVGNLLETEAAGFGSYNTKAAEYDTRAYNAPSYLIFVAAGNARNVGPAPDTPYYVWNGTAWGTSRVPRVQGPYDCLNPDSTAKNVISVGAVEDIVGGWSAAGNVVAASFTSWGPPDDGRIKPDLVANGIGLYSTFDTANDAYASYSGTSMASPSACGSAAILRDYWNKLHTYPMLPATRSSTLRGLLIHTAREAGPNNGPDYMFGWGLMDTLAAALVIKLDRYKPDTIQEVGIQNSQEIVQKLPNVRAGQKVRVTICWTDPPRAALSALDDPTRVLVNDLDLRVTDNATGTLFRPWTLDPSDPTAAAQTDRDNDRDNVEVVDFTAPSSGDYTIRVTHKGTLTNGQQPFALIIGGVYSDIAGVNIPPWNWPAPARSAFIMPAGANLTPLTINTPVTIYAAGGTATLGR